MWWLWYLAGLFTIPILLGMTLVIEFIILLVIDYKHKYSRSKTSIGDAVEREIQRSWEDEWRRENE